ncbi:MAG: hypothetical protein E7068_09490 [Lentimicrobiaceae bacterium]|nr:hypothetical protein [Lentimicrobiaceae bacterium]
MNTIVKRISIVLTMIIMSIEFSNAQDCGLSFFGVSLGQSQYSVEDYFDNNGIKYSEKEIESADSRLEINQPQMAGVKFKVGCFDFVDDKLVKSRFSSSSGGATRYDTPYYSNFLNYARDLTNKCEIVAKKLMSKYGEPTIVTDNIIEWHIGNCIIELEYEYQHNDMGYGGVDVWVALHLRYYYESQDY